MDMSHNEALNSNTKKDMDLREPDYLVLYH